MRCCAAGGPTDVVQVREKYEGGRPASAIPAPTTPTPRKKGWKGKSMAGSQLRTPRVKSPPRSAKSKKALLLPPKPPPPAAPAPLPMTIGERDSEPLRKFKEVFLPLADITDEGAQARKQAWHSMDANGNGLASLAEVDGCIQQMLMAKQFDISFFATVVYQRKSFSVLGRNPTKCRGKRFDCETSKAAP